ncbi:MAG: hypothetical protein FWD06_04830 [Oscillospiraceae bacterium]|nr:hypothetical protein [Oscillospiraceae bacterium]
MATAPCVSPQTSTNLSGAIAFGAPDCTTIPFQVSAGDITEENITTSALFSYPCTVGSEPGHALCLGRGQPLPGTPNACDIVPESQVMANAQTARAVRFIIGNLAQSPNYEFDDPEAVRIRALLARGFAMWNEGFFGNVMLYLAEVGGVGPGISAAQLSANSFAGPWNSWDAQGMAQVALWFLLGQFPPDGNLTFLDGAGNLMNAENRYRIFNGYTMFHLLAQAYACGELTCEGDMPGSSLQFTGAQTTFSSSSCASREVTVGPFILSGCAGEMPHFSLSSGVATSDAAGKHELNTAPADGQPFWIRVQPQATPMNITMQAAVQAIGTQPTVYYYRQAGATQTLALLRNTGVQELQTQHTITIAPTPANETEDDDCDPCCFPHFFPQPVPVPCAPAPLVITSNNNNNNNNNNNSSNNNNNNNMINQMLQNLQTHLILQFLQRQQPQVVQVPQPMPQPCPCPIPQPMPCSMPQPMPCWPQPPWR